MSAASSNTVRNGKGPMANVPSEVQTPEQAERVVDETFQKLGQARLVCDLPTSVSRKRKAYAKYQILHGDALGEIRTFWRVGLLGNIAYNEYIRRVQQLLRPTIIG